MRLDPFRNVSATAVANGGQPIWAARCERISHSEDLVLVLPAKTRKNEAQNGVKFFRMNNFLVIVLDNAIRIITLRKPCMEGGEAPSAAESHT